jgi:hypothetical protein
MTVSKTPATDDAATTFRSDGNEVDFHYLEEARAALPRVIAIIRAASSRGAAHDVRGLAHEALPVQTRRLAAISDYLLAADRPETPCPRPSSSDGASALDGPTLEVFADALTAHAHASIAAARTEMIAGASRDARAIAEDAIRAEYRQLAALDLLLMRQSTVTVSGRSDHEPGKSFAARTRVRQSS